MTTNPLRIESLVSGFIYLLGIIFLVFRFLGLYDLSVLDNLNDYQLLISAIVIATSYAVGILVNKIILVLLPPSVRFMKKLFTRSKKMKSRTSTEEGDKPKSLVYLAQYGSDALNNMRTRLNISVAYYRSVIFGLPFLMICFGLWLEGSGFPINTWVYILVAISSSLIGYLPYKRQIKTHNDIEKAIFEEVRVLRKKHLEKIEKN